MRQSPPPVADESQIPPGAVLSPPDSANCSSDDEDGKEPTARQLENLEELHAAIRTMEEQRAKTEIRIPTELEPQTKPLKVVVPLDDNKFEEVGRKLGHSRSSTEPSILLDLGKANGPETPSTGSEEEYEVSDEEERSRRKPPMLRKKSGELVRPALRGSSTKRRPSSMPGTPTFSKAVHFDSHLEHVRHFLQVDRPLAVSAGSSPVDSYESDNEFPFGSDEGSHHGHPWEWEIITTNFPPVTPARLAQPVRVERVFLSADNKTLVGTVAVANLAFHKHVVARFTLDYWKTTSEVVAEYNHDIRQQKHTDGYDRFNFNIKLADLANLEAKTMFFCVKYVVNGQEYWDNNNFTNFQVDFRKKAKPQNGKKGSQGAPRSSNSLPRSHKKPIPARPKSMPVAFDDFGDGFDTKYNPEDFKQPINELLGESHPTIRLKGVRSAVTLPVTNRKPTAVHHSQAFGHRYDFGASLSATIRGGNPQGDRDHLYMKSATRNQPKSDGNAKASNQNAPATSTAPRTQLATGSEKPLLSSESYNELLDKYCFVRTRR